MLYEYHSFLDDELKIIHHIDELKKNKGFLSHLHYNVELLLMRKGSAEIWVDDQSVILNENELAVIAPNRIHKSRSISEICEYYCLIIDHSVYDDWFKKEERKFPLKCTSKAVTDAYKSVFTLLNEKPSYYKQEAKAQILIMLSNLFRLSNEQGYESSSPSDSHRIDMTRKAIIYMYENFASDISVEDMAKAVGFSKYYFCRSFKEITGQTPLWHLNFIRLRSAKAFLKSNKSSITEAALNCGFNNTSYFCKLYKKYFGKSPKQDL
ncbi:MAG: helix-turn-helix transcriptional regulator [Clostridia bacterium]|nr:helix-turn-helix transcriptional regulator [Clostridia bacterium]